MLKNKSAKKKVNKELLRRPDVYVTALSSKNELKAARTATTGEIFDTLDERIDHEVDRLNKKIDVTMLQQEDKENHTIENTVDGMTTDMVVKGRTLNNLYKPNNTRDDAGEYILVDTLVKDEPKDRVVYIVNNTNRILLLNVYKISGEWDSNPIIRENSISKLDLTGKRLTGFLGMYDRGWTNSEDDKEILRNTCIVLDREETYMPQEYFESIKSFGQQENKISILSHGKNFFKINEFSEKINEKGELEFKADGNSRVANYMQIYTERNLNSKIIFNGYDSVGREFTTVNQEKYYIWVGLHGDKKDNKVWGEIILPKNTTCYCSAINEKGDNFVKFKDIQIEIGTSKTHYEPYKEDKKDILLSEYGFEEGLRGLNNIVYDELNDTKNMAIKRIDKRVFNGNETWYNSTVPEGTDNETIRFQTKLPNAKDNNGDKFIANYPTGSGGTTNIDAENIQVSNGVLYIRVKKSKLETQDLNGFVKWLKSNPLTIYFELKEPVETPLDESIALKVFNEKTYVEFQNSISGTSSFKAPVNTVDTIARLNRENRALEEENKTLRQDFESTTLSLTDSDLELVKQNVDIDFRLMEVEFALDIPQAILSSNIKFKNKKGEVKSMARTPYEMMKIVILSGDYDREDYIHKVGKYYERGRMTKEEHDELMSLMTADEVISK